MKIPKLSARRYKWLLKSKPHLLGMNILEAYIIFILIVGASSAFYITHKKLPAKVAVNTNQSSESSNLCVEGSANCPTLQLPSTSSNSTSTSSSTAKTTNGQNCSQTEASQGQILSSNLASALNSWSPSGTSQAEINYYYNQTAQYDYSLYVRIVKEAGCTPHVASPALKYPATAPSTASSPTYTAPVATCNTSQEATYTSQYDAAVQQENQNYETLVAQGNAGLAYMSEHGAGGSSAYQQLEAQIAQTEVQHTSTLSQLYSSYQSELTSIDC